MGFSLHLMNQCYFALQPGTLPTVLTPGCPCEAVPSFPCPVGSATLLCAIPPDWLYNTLLVVP